MVFEFFTDWLYKHGVKAAQVLGDGRFAALSFRHCRSPYDSRLEAAGSDVPVCSCYNWWSELLEPSLVMWRGLKDQPVRHLTDPTETVTAQGKKM